MKFSLAAVAWVAFWCAFAGAEGVQDLKKQLQAAPRLEVETLGEPVRTIRRGLLLFAPNPDGKSYDLLQIYFPRYGGPNSIVVVDLGTGQVKRIDTKFGWNLHLCPAVLAPNGKLFISILDRRLRQKICIYDPRTNKLTIDAVPLPDELLGETHPFVLGTDGKLYAIGQHPSRAAAAARIDPDTLEVTFYGPIGPSHAPNPCWGYSGAADDRYIYIASGKVPWYLVAYDRQTGQSHTLVETGTVGGYVGVSQLPDGCEGHASGIKGTDGKRRNFWLYQGKAIPKATHPEPPWPKRPPRPAPPPRPQVEVGLATPDQNGFAELWVRPPGAKDVSWRKFRFQVPVFGQSIYRLVEMPDGRLLGTAGAYMGNFIFDPKTGKARHLGRIGLSHYATAFLGGKVYMSGYPTSPLYVFDPTKPWTAGKFINGRLIPDDDPEANPRRVLYLGRKNLAGTHKMYAAAVGADGLVYFGGRWIRDGACGGMAWFDPATGKAGGTWQPFSNYQLTHMAAVRGGRYIVVSTRRVSDPILGKPKPAQGALFVFDTRSKTLGARLEPVERAKGTGPLCAVGDGSVLGWAPDPDDKAASFLYRADVGEDGTLRLAFRRHLPFPLPVAVGSNQQEAWDFRPGPDGKVWTFIGAVLVRIDPKDGSLEPVGKVSPPGRIAFTGGRIYLGGTTELRRIKGLTVSREGIAR